MPSASLLRGRDVVCCPTDLHIGTEYTTTWAYESDTGRLSRVTGPGLPGNGVLYTYQGDSNLVAVTAYVDGSDVAYGSATRTFEDHRDLVDTVKNEWKVSGTMTTISQYAYTSNALGEREKVVNTGTAFSQARHTDFTYDDRGELTESKRYNDAVPPPTPVANQDFQFDYDSIGNRQSYVGDALEGAMSYTANSLNQYTATSQPAESFAYDRAGNLTQDGRNDYTYDGENRLVTVTPRTVTPSSVKVKFTYDYLGRRVRKEGWPSSGGGWSPNRSIDRRFVYDGWNVIEELNGLASNAVLFKYTWGLDLAGQNGSGVAPASQPVLSGMHAAGGIGGLLAMYDTKGTPGTTDDRQMAYFYNGNGDVGQLIDSNPSAGTFGTTQAKYEYYPFGGILTWSGAYGMVNPFKFSTKYRDSETSLYDYGRRYLIPRLGRWVNRDPIGERGGLNLYAAMRNDPVDRFDPHGLACASGGCGQAGTTMWESSLMPLLPPCGPMYDTQPPTTTEPATAQPTTGPATTQPTPASKDCEATLAEVRGDPDNQRIEWELIVQGCPFDVKCDPAAPPGGKQGGTGGAPVGGTIIIGPGTTKEEYRHELIHALEGCKKLPGPVPRFPFGTRWGPLPPEWPDDVACREIRAYTCSGMTRNVIAGCIESLGRWCDYNPMKCPHFEDSDDGRWERAKWLRKQCQDAKKRGCDDCSGIPK